MAKAYADKAKSAVSTERSQLFETVNALKDLEGRRAEIEGTTWDLDTAPAFGHWQDGGWKEENPEFKTMFIGTHPSALPERTLIEERLDFVCQGEGPFTIIQTVEALKANSDDFQKVGGLWYWRDGVPTSNPTLKNIKNLDEE